MGDYDETVRLMTQGGNDLARGKAAFVAVDLVHERLWAYTAVEYAEIPPVFVGAGWHMRWEIPPIGNDDANSLLGAIAPHAHSLFKNAAVREEPLGVILYAGAGTSIDEIQRKCAAAWRKFGQAR